MRLFQEAVAGLFGRRAAGETPPAPSVRREVLEPPAPAAPVDARPRRDDAEALSDVLERESRRRARFLE